MFEKFLGKLIYDDIKAWFDPTNDQQCFTADEIIESVNTEDSEDISDEIMKILLTVKLQKY